MIFKNIAIGLVLLGLTLFWVAYHNIDISYNMLYLDIPVDTNFLGNARDTETLFLEGMFTFTFSIFCFIVAFILLLWEGKHG